MENNNLQANTTKQNGFPKTILLLIFIFFVTIISIFLGYMLAAKNIIPSNLATIPAKDLLEKTFKEETITPQNNIKTKNWKKIESNEKGYPILTSNKNGKGTFSIYSIKKKNIHPIENLEVLGRSGESGFGSDKPKVSPNLLYTTFIKKEEKGDTLWVISNETFEKVEIPESRYATYISGWSSDSKKILYYVRNDTITDRTQGYGGYQEIKSKFDPNLDSGFFVFDIVSGIKTKLYPVDYFESFIDNNRILVRTKGQYSNDRLIIFNLVDFEADYGAIKENFGFGTGQFTFSADGSKWSFLNSKNPTNDSSIVYADFPNKEGEIIESGGWADAQSAKMSPDGKKIAYSKRSGYKEPGVPDYKVWIYNSETKDKRNYNAEGWTKAWIDENTIILETSDASKTKDYVYLLDLTTGQISKIY